MLPEDFVQNISIPVAKTPNAQHCCDFRTVSLISHTSKILLLLVKKRITPIIKKHLAKCQMGFRQGNGLRTHSSNWGQLQKGEFKLIRRFIPVLLITRKLFDRINHKKLKEVMSMAGIPEFEQRLIISHCWNQYAVVRIKGGNSRRLCIKEG
jgi:Reverse transcriptase (RNA-dependent DNA polymerase)